MSTLWSIHYCHCSKLIRRKTGKSHLCALQFSGYHTLSYVVFFYVIILEIIGAFLITQIYETVQIRFEKKRQVSIFDYWSMLYFSLNARPEIQITKELKRTF